VLGGIGHRQAAQFGQALDRTLALGDVLQQGQAVRVAQGAGDLGQRFQDGGSSVAAFMPGTLASLYHSSK
jgi:hypothetical protein